MKVIPTAELLAVEGGSYRDVARRVQSGEFVRLRRGAIARRTDELQPHQRLRIDIEAASRVLQSGTWFSHRSAALIHGLPVVVGRDSKVEVIRTYGGHGKSSRLVHARAGALDPDEASVVDGLRVTSLSRTVLDLVRTVPFGEAVMVADAALRLGLPRDRLLESVPAGRGCRRAVLALSFADSRSESPGESESRAVLHVVGLPPPELQVEIRNGYGRLIARVDFLWRSQRVIGEFDGDGKYRGDFGVEPVAAIRAEKERQAALEAMDYRVVRWDSKVLRTPGALAARLRHALASGLPVRASASA